MTTTLTRRYIAATVRNIPPTAQEDVRAELEASIADAVEARVSQGEQRTAAERTVLTELGDPAVLAAGYAERPLHLIGPRHYLGWRQLLRLLLIIVPLCAFGGTALGQTLAGEPIGTVIAQSLLAGLGAVVHVCFWVTLVFVILDRTGTDAGLGWDVDQLPELQSAGTGRVDMVAGLVILGLAAGATLWDRFRGFGSLRAGDEVLPILHPDLWPWALALFGLQAAFVIVLYVRRRWTTTLAVVNTALAVLFTALVLTALGRGQLINPEFLDAVLASGIEQDTLRTLGVVLGFAAAGISAWSIIDGWLKKRHDERSTTHAPRTVNAG